MEMSLHPALPKASWPLPFPTPNAKEQLRGPCSTKWSNQHRVHGATDQYSAWYLEILSVVNNYILILCIT